MSVANKVEDLSSNELLEKKSEEAKSANSVENEHTKNILQSILIELIEIKQYIKSIAE